MDPGKRRRLEAAGWRVGDADEFLDHPPVLFLDIDGVLNSEAFFRSGEGALRGGPLWCGDDIDMLDPVMCGRLARLVARTGCVVVVSSSWRVVHTCDDIAEFLRRRDVVVPVIGRTDNEGRERGDQIRRWLDAHPEVTRWAVVDDSADMDAVQDRFVRTSWAEGMQDEHVERLAALLSALQ